MSLQTFITEVILQRKSVRMFTDKQVTEEELITLMKAGMAAPSAKNVQPWAFIGLTDRKKMDLLAGGLPFAKMLFYAPAAIVVCGDLSKIFPSSSNELWVQDCSAAAENILLAATAMGLGTVWTALYPYPQRFGLAKSILALPENIIPLCIIPVGHPKEQEAPKDKFNPDNIHWNQW